MVLQRIEQEMRPQEEPVYLTIKKSASEGYSDDNRSKEDCDNEKMLKI